MGSHRDYSYQIGFLPILLDAASQSIFGARLLSSIIVLYLLRAGMITFVYLLVRRLASPTAALLVALGVTFLWPTIYQGGAHYLVEFLFFTSMYLLLVGLKDSSAIACGICGVTLSTIVAVRQGDGILMWGAGAGILGLQSLDLGPGR